MERYQLKFIERMEETISKWQQAGVVDQNDVVRFFHTVVGTGGTIGLHEFADIAKDQLAYVKKQDKAHWSYEEIEPLLVGLIGGNEEPTEQLEMEDESPAVINDLKPLILLIDDDHYFVDFMKRLLEGKGYVVLAALSGEKGLQIYMNQRPDCIILDLVMPDVVSFRLLDQLMEKASKEFIPVMMITGEADDKIELEAYRKGVSDYFKKPLVKESFLVRLENRLKLRKMVQNSVMIDELTGAFSRRFLEIESNRLIEAYHRYNEPFALALLDLDHFKQVNDQYGHNIGDKVLVKFVEFLNESKRKLDLVFRLGGEEFLVIFPHTTKEQAMNFLKRFLVDFHEVPFKVNEGMFHLSFSGGLTEMKEAATSIQSLIEEADQALYEAKGNGRNQIAVSDHNTVKKMHNHVHVYVVDDDPIIRQILSENIQQLNVKGVKINSLSFRDGEAFLKSDWYKPRERHIIILDRIMPRIDGLELVTKLRAEYPEAQIVILMLTARNNEKEVVQALEMGADDYVTKPFKLDELLARIKRLIQRSFM
ncbi:response regulator [Bacillus suaedae]|uniref:Response regulator n=1 Tax=Halalkalibacter suaedae TaxID=2822140 RepID=A0A940WSS8_9BACI|nr:response regulator [Bacillus suaedae]MBP3951113.1 response regulator [Bacillus suaedae]